MLHRSLLPLTLFGICSLLACGGSTKEADAPEEPAAEASPKEDAAEDTAEEPAADEGSEEAEGAGGGSSGVNPKDVLIREGTAFLLNHRESDIGKKAEEKCEKSSKDDVAKKANCLSKAINAMDREGILFDEDGEGWWYVRFGIVKGAKVEFNRVKIEVGEPSGTKLTVKTSGPDKAARRKGKVPSELNFEVPDEYTIILNDESRGRMVFEPKMGFFDAE